jgi:hypothetical protein
MTAYHARRATHREGESTPQGGLANLFIRSQGMMRPKNAPKNDATTQRLTDFQTAPNSTHRIAPKNRPEFNAAKNPKPLRILSPSDRPATAAVIEAGHDTAPMPI